MNKWVLQKSPYKDYKGDNYHLILCNKIKTQQLTPEVISYDIEYKMEIMFYNNKMYIRFNSRTDGRNYNKNFSILDDLSEILGKIHLHKIIEALFNGL